MLCEHDWYVTYVSQQDDKCGKTVLRYEHAQNSRKAFSRNMFNMTAKPYVPYMQKKRDPSVSTYQLAHNFKYCCFFSVLCHLYFLF